MKRDNTPWWPVESARIRWTEGDAPFSTRFDDIYYSRENGAAESRYVFLSGNDLPSRWHSWQGRTFFIGETGFGTGLNFLLTWQLWLQQPAPRPRLHYVALEKYPLNREELARALASWVELESLAAPLVAAWPGLIPGQHRVLLQDGDITLDLWWEDAAGGLHDLAAQGPRFDAWYLDGFAPARNGSMWSEGLFESIARLSRAGATFSTFTAAGHVRRGLAEVGFRVLKVPGYGRKRECLRGHLVCAPPPAADAETAWDLPRNVRPPPHSAIVLGAGLAGCSVAAALRRRGLDIHLLDRRPLASQASGNEQGVLYTRLSRRHSTLTDFALQSFRFSATRYAQLFAGGRLRSGVDGAICGSFHEQSDEEEMGVLSERLAHVPELASVLDPEGAEQWLGVRPSRGGYWYPESGWLRPPAVCRALLEEAGVTAQENCPDFSLRQVSGGWQLCADGEICFEAECVVVCTGTAASALPGLEWLPLQAIRGQTTNIPATPQSRRLRGALCHEGYIAPARREMHCIGATFTLRDPGPELRSADHHQNIEKLAGALPAWRGALQDLDISALTGRVGFRCASPDYLPIAGPVPERDAFLRCYAGLRKNARQLIPERGVYMPGLYVNTAHGSRGLSSTLLVAELLASQICGEPPPLSREISRGLSPGRFLIRDLSRGRI